MEMDMSFDASERDAAARERLSALVDGELEGDAVTQACGHWRDDGGARSTWHAYQLIGDVLRSDDLADGSSRDAAFLTSFRLRMKDEPVVLAPQPRRSLPFLLPATRPTTASVGARRGRWSWGTSSAVAAGFVLVAGAVTLTRNPASDAPASAPLAQLTPDASSVAPVARPMTASAIVSPSRVDEPQALVANGTLIRDARLDRYLAAHKQFAGSSALGVPSGFLRNAAAIESAR
jgi:sigma-E factor negative regulatory protein RseA